METGARLRYLAGRAEGDGFVNSYSIITDDAGVNTQNVSAHLKWNVSKFDDFASFVINAGESDGTESELFKLEASIEEDDALSGMDDGAWGSMTLSAVANAEDALFEVAFHGGLGIELPREDIHLYSDASQAGPECDPLDSNGNVVPLATAENCCQSQDYCCDWDDCSDDSDDCGYRFSCPRNTINVTVYGAATDVMDDACDATNVKDCNHAVHGRFDMLIDLDAEEEEAEPVVYVAARIFRVQTAATPRSRRG